VCRVNRGAHVEHLQLSKKKTFSAFLGLWTIVIVINVCNHGEHYETPYIMVVEQSVVVSSEMDTTVVPVYTVKAQLVLLPRL
jgi:hypothetical protein